MKSRFFLLSLWLTLLIPPTGYGQEQQNPDMETVPAAAQGNDEAANKTTEATNETSAETTPSQSPDALQERKFSDAFEIFVPSESISADNAVPFPVDI